MSTLETAASLAAAIEGEIAGFDAYVEAQKAFSAALRGRDWPALQETTNLLESLAAHLGEVEAARAEAEAALRAALGLQPRSEGEMEGFYRLISLLPEPERSALADLYRRLKICVMRAKFENRAAGDYATAQRALLGSVLEELFPEKKGRIYGRAGKTIQAGHDAILLDAAL